MRDAAARRDAAALAAYVDFPALRGSVKSALADRVATSPAIAGSPFGAFGAALANTLGDGAIDALLTPDSVALMMSGIVPPLIGGPAAPAPAGGEPETTATYEDLGHFRVGVKPPGALLPPLELELSRYGLFGWKLTAVRLP
jgi:hypothetical protein